MKKLFAFVLLLLIAASFATTLTLPERQSEVPILYWVTDNNPARDEQIRLFHQWLVENGHTRPGHPDQPICELRTDTANASVEKKIIHSAAGVCGDAIDMGTGAGDQHYFYEMGFLRNVTEDAKRLNFGPDQSWPAIEDDLVITTVDGDRVQVCFPCNVAISPLWVNKETFRKAGMAPPPTRWTFEEFERIGKEFVEKANAGKQFQDVFFVMNVATTLLHRSLGLSRYNETLTRCALDDPRFVRVLNMKYKWMYEDHLLPSQADRESFATLPGYGGTTLQLFNQGNIAMFDWGRYALIQLREFGELDLTIVEPPNGGYPNTLIGSRSAGVYTNSKHPELAVLFLAFLASETYNEQIVADADALPPNPAYTKTENFLRPPDYPNEWGVHEAFAKMADEIAISSSISPFVSPDKANTLINNAEAKFMNHMQSAEETAREAGERVNQAIDRKVEEFPQLQGRYKELCERQKLIDARLADLRAVEALQCEGKPVPADLLQRAQPIPLEWIENPFYRRYYRDKGWAE